MMRNAVLGGSRPRLSAILVLGATLAGGAGAEEALRAVGGRTSFELWPTFGEVGLELVGGDRVATEEPGVLVTFFVDPVSSTITPEVEGLSFFGFGSGSFRHHGGALLRWPGGEADLSGFALRSSLRAGPPDTTFDLLDTGGEVVFLLDHAHVSIRSDPSYPSATFPQ